MKNSLAKDLYKVFGLPGISMATNELKNQFECGLITEEECKEEISEYLHLCSKGGVKL